MLRISVYFKEWGLWESKCVNKSVCMSIFVKKKKMDKSQINFRNLNGNISFAFSPNSEYTETFDAAHF